MDWKLIFTVFAEILCLLGFFVGVIYLIVLFCQKIKKNKRSE